MPALAEVIEIAPAATTYYYVPATTPTDTRTYYYVTEGPVTEVYYEAPVITVEAPRLTEDQQINAEVVDSLAADPYLSGRIGVQTRDRDVNLTGSVATPGQVRRAVRDARSVPGVDHVSSELRPRVGANTSY
jgi:hypothetical protein